jgi:pimeloyl-ACP methyl ester carboxylesterase
MSLSERAAKALAVLLAGGAVAAGLARVLSRPRNADLSIYRTPEGEAVFRRLYERAVERLDVELERIWVDSQFGPTHVLAAGPPDAPPVVVTHGGNSINPISLEWFRPLLSEYRMYAPDTVGHPGYSARRRLSPSGDEYGRWLVDVFDGLHLERPAVVGGSYGAGIILRAAAHAPQRISMAALVAPSGIVAPPMGPLVLRLALPMLLYRLLPTRERLLAAAGPMFHEGEPIDPFWLETIEAAFRHLKVESKMPRAASAEELRGFAAPTLVIAGENDVLFPGRRVVDRAWEIFPNLEEAVMLPGASHVPSSRDLEEVRRRIRSFLDRHHRRPGASTTDEARGRP